MTDEQMGILHLVRKNGGITLAGNREYYSTLKLMSGNWVIVSGDSMTGEESSSHVNDEQALCAIITVVRDRMGIYGPDHGEVSQEEILNWLRKNPF